jgi:carboxymethylenebutenolidase
MKTVLGNFITLTAHDGHRLDAYHADASPRIQGGIVVLQEAFGVNEHIRWVCNDYAARGYTAVAPALYDRQQPNAEFGYDDESLQQARQLRRGLDYDKVLLDIEAAVAVLRPHGNVGVVGYCVGGSAAWLAASRLSVDAAACYYPSDITKQLSECPRCPVVMHFAERDHFIPREVVDQFRTTHPQIAAFSYPADHGFNCSHRARSYDAASAALSLERTLALFDQHLARR